LQPQPRRQLGDEAGIARAVGAAELMVKMNDVKRKVWSAGYQHQ